MIDKVNVDPVWIVTSSEDGESVEAWTYEEAIEKGKEWMEMGDADLDYRIYISKVMTIGRLAHSFKDVDDDPNKS